MGPDKRHAVAVPSGQQRNEKKQKTTTSTALSTPKAAKPTEKTAAPSTVVPATPGAAVDASAKRKQQQESPAKEPRPEKRPKTTQTERAASKKQSPKQPAQKQPSEPISLPLEPHAAILKDLESKYDVHTLSVISSSKMEKRIKSILGHLERKPAGDSTQPKQTPLTSRPGIVLLHCRVADTNKMISIAEIVKQRIREGHFSKETGDAAKKKGKKASKLSSTAWYQYNRIYDVSTPKEASTSAAGEDGEDDGFAPMVHRLDDAARGKHDSQRQVTTYMSIILSRTPVVELQKNPDISVQASTDPLVVEFEQWVDRT